MVTSYREDRTAAGHEKWLEHARNHLRAADPVLAKVIADRPDFDPRRWLRELPPMDLFGALLFQVVGQQLSVAATRATIARLEERFGGRLPSAAEVLDADPAQFRDAGLSWPATSPCARRSGRSTASITCRPRKKCSASPRTGGRTAVWRPPTCSRPHSQTPRRHRAAHGRRGHD